MPSDCLYTSPVDDKAAAVIQTKQEVAAAALLLLAIAVDVREPGIQDFLGCVVSVQGTL